MAKRLQTKVYCTNCAKGLHNTPKKTRCKGKECECNCRYYYVNKYGHLTRFGEKPTEPDPNPTRKLEPLPAEVVAWNKKLQKERLDHEEEMKKYEKNRHLGKVGDDLKQSIFEEKTFEQLKPHEKKSNWGNIAIKENL